MEYVGVEFAEEDGGGIALVLKLWFTPRKKEVFWPPCKLPSQFQRTLKNQQRPDDTWKTYKIKKCYFECDSFEKARKKLILLENTSDVQTPDDDEPREKRKNRRLSFNYEDDLSSSDSNSEQVLRGNNKANLIRPPIFKENPISNSNNEQVSRENNTLNLISPPKNLHSNNNREQDLGETVQINETDNSFISFSSRDAYEPDSKKLFSILLYVKQQNEQILKLLQSNASNVTITSQLPDNLCDKFPLNTAVELDEIEEYLNNKENITALCSYFSTLGGRDLTSKTNTILKYILTNGLASNYSFLGMRNGKKPFAKLNLKAVVIRSVQAVTQATQSEINDAIKVWLKHAPQRLIKEKGKCNSV